LRSANIAQTHIAGRAIVYGLGRMYIDGHFAQWAVDGQSAEATAQNVLKEFVSLLGKAEATPRTEPGVAAKRKTRE
jgi:hypothetical protein